MFVEPNVSKNGNKRFPLELDSACHIYTTKWKYVLVGPDQHGMERLRNENGWAKLLLLLNRSILC